MRTIKLRRTKAMRSRGPKWRRKPPASSHGQSLVEFGIGITILLILLAGILDLGRAYFTLLALQDAAAEGAVYGSTTPLDSSGIRARVRATSQWPVDFATFTDSQITVDLLGPACAGNDLKLTVNLDFEMIAPFIGGRTLPLAAEAIYTILAPPC